MEMMHRRRILTVLTLFLLAGIFAAPPAIAQSLDALRKSGVVGERYDGYLVLRQANAPADVRSLVTQVNAKRKKIYEERAKQQNVPADQVGQVYAKEIFQSAPSGTWFLGADGRWVKK